MELKSFFDFTKLPTKIFLVISIVAGFFVFSPPDVLKKFRLDKFEEYGGYVGLAFLFTTILVVINFITWLYNKISFNQRTKKIKLEIRETLKSLDHREKSVLREFFIRGQSSIGMPIGDDVIAGLLEKNILKMNSQINGSSIGSGLTFALSISNYVNKILTYEDIDFVVNPTESQKQQILNNRPNWVRTSWY